MSSRKKSKKSSSGRGEAKIKSIGKSGIDLRMILCAIALVVFSFIAFQNALDNDFVTWDDPVYVLENDLVRSLGNTGRKPVSDVFKSVVSSNYHPLTMLSLRWNDNQCSSCPEGISARPFILTNLIFHILNAILVLVFAFLLTRGQWLASFFIALVFALHPMHVESVAWISERKDVLYAFFFVSGLIAYFKYLKTDRFLWLGLAFTLYILSCLSKAMAVVFPLMMLLVYFWQNKEKDNFKAIRQSLGLKFFKHSSLFFLVSIIFGTIALNVQSGGNLWGLLGSSAGEKAINEFEVFSIMERIQFASYGYLEYIIKFFFPADMCTYYAYPESGAFESSIYYKLAPVIVLLVNMAAVWSLKHLKGVFVGMGMFLVNLILVLQFISVGQVIMADRYSYLAYIGLSFCIVCLVFFLAPKTRQNLIFGILCVLVICLIPVTQAQVETWSNTDKLFTNVIEINTVKTSGVGSNLGPALRLRGNYYGKQAERATSEQERKAFLDKSYADYKLAADMGSDSYDVYEGLGTIAGMRGDYSTALSYLDKALELEPSNYSIYFNRGITYALTGNHTKAIEDFSKVIEGANIFTTRAYKSRAISYFNLNMKEEARKDFQEVLRRQPNDQNALNYLRQLSN